MTSRYTWLRLQLICHIFIFQYTWLSAAAASSASQCNVQVPTSKLDNLMAVSTGPNSVVIQWDYSCEEQQQAFQSLFTIKYCPVTATQSCNEKLALMVNTTKNRLLLDSLTPDTRYLLEISASTIHPTIKTCVRTQKDDFVAKTRLPAEKLRIGILVISSIFALVLLFILLYALFRQIRQFQYRKSSLIIKVDCNETSFANTEDLNTDKDDSFRVLDSHASWTSKHDVLSGNLPNLCTTKSQLQNIKAVTTAIDESASHLPDNVNATFESTPSPHSSYITLVPNNTLPCL